MNQPGLGVRDEIVASQLTGCGYEGGAIERVEETSGNCVKVMGQLIALLHKKGKLTLGEVSEMAGVNINRVEPDDET